MRALLSRERVAFTARNVEEDDLAYDELVELGFRTVPVTVVHGRPVKGYDEAALMAALRDAGLLSPGR